MLPEKYQWLAVEFEPEGDPFPAFQVGVLLEKEGNLEGAATALDRAFGIDPTNEAVRSLRASVLNRLAVTEHGLVFRYVPAGMFLMGSADGDPDERPRRPVFLDAFWIAQVPTTRPDHQRLRQTFMPGVDFDEDFDDFFGERIRFGYCDYSGGLSDIDMMYDDESAEVPPDQPRPTVAVSWKEVEQLARKMSSRQVRYGLPTEAQWEKAARGGLIARRYPWGDDPPTPEQSDVGRFWHVSILPARACPPNGSGLYAMCGGVWEWCADWYDRDAYRESPDLNPAGPAKGKERVLRGGSWADCAAAATVSFRMSGGGRRRDERITSATPNIGFRLCRVQT